MLTKTAPRQPIFYVAGTLTILAMQPVAPGLHALLYFGPIRTGMKNNLVIVGSSSYIQSKNTSNTLGTTIRVIPDSGTRQSIMVKAPKGFAKEPKTFTNTLANGKSCKINLTSCRPVRRSFTAAITN